MCLTYDLLHKRNIFHNENSKFCAQQQGKTQHRWGHKLECLNYKFLVQIALIGEEIRWGRMRGIKLTLTQKKSKKKELIYSQAPIKLLITYCLLPITNLISILNKIYIIHSGQESIMGQIKLHFGTPKSQKLICSTIGGGSRLSILLILGSSFNRCVGWMLYLHSGTLYYWRHLDQSLD